MLEEIVAFTDENHLMIVINPHAPACTYASYKMMEEAGFYEEIHHLLVGSESIEVYKDQYIIRDINSRYHEMDKDNFEISYELFE